MGCSKFWFSSFLLILVEQAQFWYYYTAIVIDILAFFPF